MDIIIPTPGALFKAKIRIVTYHYDCYDKEFKVHSGKDLSKDILKDNIVMALTNPILTRFGNSNHLFETFFVLHNNCIELTLWHSKNQWVFSDLWEEIL